MKGVWRNPGFPGAWLVVGLAGVMSLSGCGIEKYGSAAYYDGPEPKAFKVVLPAGAPYISQQFSESAEQGASGHNGIDIWAALHTPIIAAAPGLVTQSFYEPAYGNRVVIDHGTDATGQRHWTVYKHLKDRQVAAGTRVARGQQIATMGATGALGMMVHLHFEVVRGKDPLKGKAMDPQLFWADGPGRVTCFPASQEIPADKFRTTYPVPCRGS